MADFDPLYVDVDLPDRVLLQETPLPDLPKAAATLHPNDADAVWYRGCDSAMTLDPNGAIAVWTPENRLGTVARPAEPNLGNARLAPQGGVAFIRELNGGFAIDAALVDAEEFCFAVRVTSPEGQARTLVTVNPPDGDNYLFLSEKDGLLEWRDDAGSVEATLPAPGGAFWVVVGYDQGKISLTAAKPGAKFPAPKTSLDASEALARALSGASDLFIGCRSHRKGIVKTLGHSVIHDVLFWLDTAGTTPAEMDKITQACRFVEAQGTAS